MEFLVRLAIRVMVWTLYKVRVIGGSHVPKTGPALIVSNHLSLMDGFLVGWGARHRRVRFMIWRPYYEHWAFGIPLRALKTIPVDSNGPRAIVAAMQAARVELEAGHVVCIFAEGSVSRTGNILPFKRGLEKILSGLKQVRDVPVVPTHLDRVWGGFLSFSGDSFGGKWPSFRRPITASFGEPLPATVTAFEARRAVAALASDAFPLRKRSSDTLPARFIRAVRENWSRPYMADTTGKDLAYGRALTGALILASEIRKRAGDQKMIGLLLPSTVGGALANLGVALAGKVAVNLNFTAGKANMDLAIEQCQIRTVLTSKVFLEKAKLDAPPGAVYLEDILKSVGGAAKLIALLKARLAPASLLTPRVKPEDLATVIFSSGSTGVPKGVMLSHYNLISNVDSVLQLFHLDNRDCILGILPFFHSFGYMATIWLPPLAGGRVAYHPNPTEAKIIGELIEKHQGTFLLSTPTFCQTYLRKCTPEQFATLRYIVVGAEKLREPLRIQFRDTFGKELLEGYGCTELSPVVAVNSPDVTHGAEQQTGTRHGTIGLPIPGVDVRIVDPDTRVPLPIGEAGMLEVRGPNRMLGYLGQPQRTAEVFDGPWYVTGDIAALDEEGFIRITDRLSRFSKIGGEMVPHLKIEEVIASLFEDCPCAVTGIPDDRKGERLAILYASPNISPDEIRRALTATDLPNLWIPKNDSIHRVEALPVLGSGKLDLRGLRKMAVELTQVSEPK